MGKEQDEMREQGKVQRPKQKRSGVTGMSEREYRRFCQERRRRLALRRNVVLGAAAVLMVLLSALSLHALTGRAAAEDVPIDYKYYTYYTVQAGDTLESIAGDHADDHYSGADDYAREVVGINALFADSTLRSGQEIVLPYYSPEYR